MTTAVQWVRGTIYEHTTGTDPVRAPTLHRPGGHYRRRNPGVCRWLGDLGYAALTEFKLGNGRRADVAGLSPDGRIVMIEVKSTVQDFRADDKWLDYVPYCDGFPLPYPAIFHSKFYLRPVAFWSPTITGQRLFGQP